MTRVNAHPDEGEWRAYLDGELPPDRLAALRTHLSACSACQARLAEVQAVSRFAGNLLGVLTEAAERAPVPTDRLFAGVQPFKEEIPVGEPRRFKVRYALAAAATAFALSLFVPGLRARAADWVSIFRVKESRIVRLSTDDVKAAERFTQSGLPDLILNRYLKEQVLTKEQSGETDKLMDLHDYGFTTPGYIPAGYNPQKGFWVDPGARALTPDVDGINALLASSGSKLQLPAELKGQTVRVAFRPITSFTWTKEGKELRVMEGEPPILSVSGNVDVNKLAASLGPVFGKEIGLSGDLLAQIKGLDLSSTLPLPVVQGQGQEVTIHGHKGTFYEAKGGNLIAWMSGSRVNLVSGSEPLAELLKVAESLEE